MFVLNNYRIRSLIVGIVVVMIITGGNVRADFTFGEPTNLGSHVNSVYDDFVGFESTDGLEFYLCSGRPPISNFGFDIWIINRPTTEEDWGEPFNPGQPLNTSYHEEPQCISADGLELYIDSDRPGAYGGEDIWVAKRNSKEDAWETPVNLGPRVNSSGQDYGAWISANGLELYYCSTRSGGYGRLDLYITKRATLDAEWGEPENLGPGINSSAGDMYPTVSANGTCLIFSDYRMSPYRTGGLGGGDIWISMRKISEINPDGYWDEPVNLGPMVNSSAWDGVPRISPDGSKLYFSSTRSGGYGGDWGDIYQAPVIPIVDLNDDGIVDATDMCIIVDHWGTDEPLCDIGPTPFGDGVVDVEDLIVLAKHLFETIPGRPIEP